MNVEMVEMLIDRLGAIEDTLRVRLDKIENAIVDFGTEPRLQDLTPEKLRGTLTTELLAASRKGLDWICITDLEKDEIAILKRNGFRVLRGPDTQVDWSMPKRVYSDRLWEEL